MVAIYPILDPKYGDEVFNNANIALSGLRGNVLGMTNYLPSLSALGSTTSVMSL